MDGVERVGAETVRVWGLEQMGWDLRAWRLKG